MQVHLTLWTSNSHLSAFCRFQIMLSVKEFNSLRSKIVSYLLGLSCNLCGKSVIPRFYIWRPITFVEAAVVVVFLVDALPVDNFVDKDSLASALCFDTVFHSVVDTVLLTKLFNDVIDTVLLNSCWQSCWTTTHRHPHRETDISSRVRTILEPSDDGKL